MKGIPWPSQPCHELGYASVPFPACLGASPDGPGREVSVGAAGGRAGAGVVEDGDQRVGGGADHGLQVEAVVRQRGNGQGPLPGPLRQPRTGETRAWGRTGEGEGESREKKIRTGWTNTSPP